MRRAKNRRNGKSAKQPKVKWWGHGHVSKYAGKGSRRRVEYREAEA